MSSISFADLGIGQPLLSTLTRLGMETPTQIQAQAIPLLLAGNDLIASAPTGTGKTVAFLLPAFMRLLAGSEQAGADRPKGRGARMLILTPTRELAQQVAKASQSIAQDLQRFSTVCITGGEPYPVQQRLLAAPHEVLVATPGRLIDQIQSRRIDLSRIEVLVLDEADRMLDMGFAEEVLGIAQRTPKNRQTLCFTATLSRSVRELSNQLLKDPKWLEVQAEAVADNESIDQHVIYVDNIDHKRALLNHCLADEGMTQAIVFASTKRETEQLARELSAAGVDAAAMHGDLMQRERTRTLNRIRRGECKVLVATDVAARGLDIPAVSHVFNFDLPKFAEDYVHRIGRTGRAGASGQAISFVSRDDVLALRRIERFIGGKVQVSLIEGLEAAFKPSELRAGSGRPGAGRKPGYGGQRRQGAGGGGYRGSNNRGQRKAA